MNNHQYLFYFTKDYQECYEEWENGKLIHSKVTALGTAMFELLSFCQSDELISYALQALSALSKNETAELLGLNKYEMSLSVTYGIRNGYLAEMLRPKDATDIIFYTLCRASLLKQSKNLCVSVCRRCGQYFFSVKYGRSVKYCNHVNETGYEGLFGVNQESDTLVDCILTFIEFNLEKQFTIEWLSREYSTNRTTLMADFKRVTGKTINEFVLDKRIDLSKQILAFTNISIEELALKCGFSSQSYFTRAFKKKTGLSPMQFRKQAVEKRISEFQK